MPYLSVGGKALLIRFMLPSYAALGVCTIVVSAGNALGWPLRAMLMLAARLFVFYLPCRWVGAWLGDLLGLAMGASLGNLLAGLAGLAAWRCCDGSSPAPAGSREASIVLSPKKYIICEKIIQ